MVVFFRYIQVLLPKQELRTGTSSKSSVNKCSNFKKICWRRTEGPLCMIWRYKYNRITIRAAG